MCNLIFLSGDSPVEFVVLTFALVRAYHFIAAVRESVRDNPNLLAQALDIPNTTLCEFLRRDLRLRDCRIV